jgi:D-3-phosphoglycerate dehydrogenase
MKALVIGDSYYPAQVFADVFKDYPWADQVRYAEVDSDAPFSPATESEKRLRECIGTPADVIGHLHSDDDVLVMHGAPVPSEALDAAPGLKLICCARGGPVNLDLAAAQARGIQVTVTPGKNAEAVADLTLAFAVMLARHVPRAAAHVRAQGGLGESTYEGAAFFGNEVAGLTIGLVGYGAVARFFARLARPIGANLLAFDPFISALDCERDGVTKVDSLDDLLEASDIVSLHARATKDNQNLMGREQFARMKEGAGFINTARESLVDESALAEALRSGHVSGAALDVLRPAEIPGHHPLAELDRVVITPHIGGATWETLRRGALMAADEIGKFVAGSAPSHPVPVRKS